MTVFSKVILYTDTDGRAKFREEAIPLGEGSPQAMLSELFASGGYQLRHSPVGFRSQFHCTPNPQWVFILGGQMEITDPVTITGPGVANVTVDMVQLSRAFMINLPAAYWDESVTMTGMKTVRVISDGSRPAARQCASTTSILC